MVTTPRIGVLALQGGVREHLRVLARLGAEAVPIRRADDLAGVGGLVLPGGESAVIDRLTRQSGLAEPIRARVDSGMPVYGTCAGMILLADRVLDGAPGQQRLGGLHVTVRRNVFGRQNESFETDLAIPAVGDPPVHAVFIRAPAVEEIGTGVTVLGTLPDGRAVAVEQGPLLATAFHPEIAEGELRFHERLLSTVRAS